MSRNELVGITIQQLIEHFKRSPESFEYYDHDSKPSSQQMQPTIFFQPKVQLSDYMSTIVEDPNNNHAVIVSFNQINNELTCYLFLKAPINLQSNSSNPVADSVVSSRQWFEKWRGNYRKFNKLRKLILDRDKRKENLTYLKKLAYVFPDTLDSDLLDK